MAFKVPIMMALTRSIHITQLYYKKCAPFKRNSNRPIGGPIAGLGPYTVLGTRSAVLALLNCTKDLGKLEN